MASTPARNPVARDAQRSGAGPHTNPRTSERRSEQAAAEDEAEAVMAERRAQGHHGGGGWSPRDR